MNIVKINISRNSLKSMDVLKASKFWAQNQNCLDFSYNQISNLPSWMFTMELRTELYLKGNPFKCPCTAVEKFSQFYEVPVCIQLPKKVSNFLDLFSFASWWIRSRLCWWTSSPQWYLLQRWLQPRLLFLKRPTLAHSHIHWNPSFSHPR